MSAGARARFFNTNDSKSLWNYTLNPGWTELDGKTLRLALIRYGCGNWKDIARHFPFKNLNQLNGQTQRAFGQQSLAEFGRLHVDPDLIRTYNEQEQAAAFRKNGCIVRTGGPLSAKHKKMKHEAQEYVNSIPKYVATKIHVPVLSHYPRKCVTVADKIAKLNELYRTLRCCKLVSEQRAKSKSQQTNPGAAADKNGNRTHINLKGGLVVESFATQFRQSGKSNERMFRKQLMLDRAQRIKDLEPRVTQTEFGQTWTEYNDRMNEKNNINVSKNKPIVDLVIDEDDEDDDDDVNVNESKERVKEIEMKNNKATAMDVNMDMDMDTEMNTDTDIHANDDPADVVDENDSENAAKKPESESESKPKPSTAKAKQKPKPKPKSSKLKKTKKQNKSKSKKKKNQKKTNRKDMKDGIISNEFQESVIRIVDLGDHSDKSQKSKVNYNKNDDTEPIRGESKNTTDTNTDTDMDSNMTADITANNDNDDNMLGKNEPKATAAVKPNGNKNSSGRKSKSKKKKKQTGAQRRSTRKRGIKRKMKKSGDDDDEYVPASKRARKMKK